MSGSELLRFIKKTFAWFSTGTSAAQQRHANQQPTREAIATAPHHTLATARAGQLAQLKGRIRSNGNLLESPFHKRKCVYYEVMIEKLVGLDDFEWIEIVHDKKAVDFILEDESGSAMVDTSTIEADTDFDPVIDLLPKMLEKSLASYGVSYAEWGKIRCNERILAPRDTITLCGLPKWELDPTMPRTAGYRDVPKRWTIQPMPTGSVFVTDRQEGESERPRRKKKRRKSPPAT